MAAPMIGEERMEIVKLREALGDSYISTKVSCDNTYVCLDRESIVAAATLLRDDPELDYQYFVECVGVDYSRWEHGRDFPTGRFEVVYNLFSLKHNSRIFLKVSVDDGESVPTLINVFDGAEYPEREIADMFGISFEGNNKTLPGTRFLMSDDWVGFPLRKEFPLGGEDVLFDLNDRGPAVEDVQLPHAGESFTGKTGSKEVSGR